MLIRTQKELKELYGEHYDKVLGYWMSGMTKEKLDILVARLSQRDESDENVRVSGHPKLQKKSPKSKLWEIRQQDEGPALSYFLRAEKKSIPMVFELYERSAMGIITEVGIP